MRLRGRADGPRSNSITAQHAHFPQKERGLGVSGGLFAEASAYLRPYSAKISAQAGSRLLTREIYTLKVARR